MNNNFDCSEKEVDTTPKDEYNIQRKKGYGCFRCEDCGKLVYRRKRSDRRKICFECAVQNSLKEVVRNRIISQKQKQQKEGINNDKHERGRLGKGMESETRSVGGEDAERNPVRKDGPRADCGKAERSMGAERDEVKRQVGLARSIRASDRLAERNDRQGTSSRSVRRDGGRR
jgi:hypothetical protein